MLLILSACTSDIGRNTGAKNFGPIPFEATPPISSLAKVKSVMIGQGPSNSDISQVIVDGHLDQDALAAKVEEWIDTPEFRIRLKRMLVQLLQQDFEYDNTENPRHTGRLRYANTDLTYFGGSDQLERAQARSEMMFDNLRESFVRTALRFIDQDLAFNSIATTRKWEVTTGVMVLMAWIDNPRIDSDNHLDLAGRRDKAKQMYLEPNGLVNDDFDDWRPITFTQAADNISPPSFLSIPYYRGLEENDSTPFKISRVGFFSTVANRMKWVTNDDNQWRVIMNQAMITGLNLTYDTADATNQPITAGIDDDHAKGECYLCHKAMDPMRNVFTNNMTSSYRLKDVPYSNLNGSFAFFGYQQNLSSVDDFGNAIANHPRFALGWTQKLCRYFNTGECDDKDAELIRVAKVFKDSGFKFRTLLIELLSSPLITNQFETLTYQKTQGIISANRRDQLCSTLNVRFRDLQIANGQSPMELDLGQELCSKDDALDYSDNIPQDTVVRGSIGLAQPPTLNAISTRSIERLCRELSDVYIGGSENFFVFNPQNNSSYLDRLVKYLAGIDTMHPRYTALRTAAEEIYNQAFVAYGSGANAQRDGLREVFRFICEGPEVTGVGF
ncbi:MAG: hypothetical protein KDD52_08840 [Bdellovibrionales bacterium]|nr:hypothetical protein [Bdellovibrionales bacterium]